MEQERKIWLSNSLKRQKEEFIPIDEKNVRMYVCGPTVYDRAHIGNARAVVVFDTLYRVLCHRYGEGHVTYVRNITDVDDKINNAAKERGIAISEVTEKTIQMFHEDMAALNCLPPTVEPRATTHILEMQDMIRRLIANGNAYAANGHVLFRVSSDPQYGHLSGRSTAEMIAGSRVEVAPYKENPMDFVLWKPSKEDEPGWDSPWGRGRPGWHIECSAMSTKYLGDTFDIHGGGADLTFPHHENEIAQSCCANPGSEYAKFWVHNGFLSVNGEKMSKSLGNFITVKDLLDKGIKGEVIRFALLSTHYKKPLDWTEKLIDDSYKILVKLYKAIKEKKLKDFSREELPDMVKEQYDEFFKSLYDDLNTAKAFYHLNMICTYAYTMMPMAEAALIECANSLGLLQQNPDHFLKDTKDTKDINNLDISKIEELIELRKAARASKNWTESDRIRDELSAIGIIIEDKPGGVMEWRKK